MHALTSAPTATWEQLWRNALHPSVNVPPSPIVARHLTVIPLTFAAYYVLHRNTSLLGAFRTPEPAAKQAPSRVSLLQSAAKGFQGFPRSANSPARSNNKASGVVRPPRNADPEARLLLWPEWGVLCWSNEVLPRYTVIKSYHEPVIAVVAVATVLFAKHFSRRVM